MKLDATVMRTMNRQDFRVLGAVENGMKNHALVPSALIGSLSNLRHGGTHKILSSLLRDKLVSHDRSCGYDGYRLTNSGYDILALHTLKKKGLIAALGDRIGTGKESDVYVAASPEGRQVVLKFHRLGRTSFRDVKKKRDYFNYNQNHSKNMYRGSSSNQNKAHSWLFLSKISALKEFAYMKALYQVDYPTPEPLGHDRHIVVMGLIRGMPLYQISNHRLSTAQASSIFQQASGLATRLLSHGLVHCDLNEFNLLVDLSGGVQSNKHTGTGGEEESVADHYVRHTGLTVGTKGALSAHLAHHKALDGTGEVITEAPAEPLERLSETNEPKPIVTLIDFPQMVSVHHPNAEELYDRDLKCLQKFFVKKLKCEEALDWEMPPFAIGGNQKEENETNTTTLASRAQIRLDQELQASGYSEQDAQRDMELYYFNKHEMNNSDSSSDDSDDAESNDEDLCAEQEATIDEASEDEVPELVEREEDRMKHPSENTKIDLDFQIDLNNHRNTTDCKDENASLAASIFTEQSYAIAEQRARIRVQKHIEQSKKSSQRSRAFKSRNSNKTYVKGKRVFQDYSVD